jgi:DNA-binding LacI/PurR family transcriptional regulator
MRLKGIRDVYDLAGPNSGICELTSAKTPVPVGDGSTSLSSWLIEAIRRTMRDAGIEAAIVSGKHDALVYHWKTIASEMVQHCALPPLVLPLIERAVSDKEITAWVCANDDVARICLERLAQKGIAVPKGIAVVGFEDSPEALSLQLSSYNFNTAATVNAMLSHVLNPFLSSRARKSHAFVEIEGSLVCRQTA